MSLGVPSADDEVAMPRGSSLDCLIIGYNETPLEEYTSLLRQFGDRSNAMQGAQTVPRGGGMATRWGASRTRPGGAWPETRC
jgi:hypothetical protein